MKKLAIVLLITAATPCLSMTISLEPSNFKVVEFEDIPATSYKFQEGILTADVKASSSFLLHSFTSIQKIKTIQLEWLFTGDLKVKDAKHEEEKSGDDGKLRIALLVSGEAPSIPFFTPTWIKITKNHLKLPSDKMIYLSIGAAHAPGSTWESPYSSSITHYAVPSSPQEKNWQKVDYNFEKPLELVGLWIIADGDNTGSHFSSSMKNLRLLP